MKKQTPITYEHLGGFLVMLAVLFVLGSAILFWVGGSGEIKSIACYNPDGTGPVYEGCEGALAKVECYSKPHHNGNFYQVKCPFF